MINSQEIFELYDSEERTLLSYNGAFDGRVLSVIAGKIESTISNDPDIGRKVFKIFIELAQNIAYYSTERGGSIEKATGKGILILREHKDYFSCSTGNMAKPVEVKELIQKCETINILEREELREYKRKLRSMPPSKKGGGNIGLVQVALIASNPLNYKVIPIDDENSFYIVNVKINK